MNELTHMKINGVVHRIVDPDIHAALCAKDKEIESLKAQLAEARGQMVSGFYGEEIPEYAQGAPTHELQEILTAEEANGLVKKIVELRKRLAACHNAGPERKIK